MHVYMHDSVHDSGAKQPPSRRTHIHLSTRAQSLTDHLVLILDTVAGQHIHMQQNTFYTGNAKEHAAGTGPSCTHRHTRPIEIRSHQWR